MMNALMKAAKASLAISGMAFVMMAVDSVQAKDAPASTMERFEIIESRPAFEGAEFGQAGAYQYIAAKAHIRINRTHPANRGIADLDLAPRTKSGDVLYTTDVVILRPADAKLARRVMIADIPNRGMKLGLSSLNDTSLALEFAPPKPGGTPHKVYSSAIDAGNGFLFRRGYTIVWVAWQSDLSPGGMASVMRTGAPVATPKLLRADFPIATENGALITGRVQASAVFDNRDAQSVMPLAYAAAPGSEANATLSVRARPKDAPHLLDKSAWSFTDDRHIRINRPTDADGGAIYEFVYTAINPHIAGLGLAATRDVVSFLRRVEKDEVGGKNPLADLRNAACAYQDKAKCNAASKETVDYAIGIGSSQSGRYLRDMMWQGFNSDGAGKPVLDGALVNVAGSRKTFTNKRWAEPGRFSRQHEDWLVYGNQFPFAYSVSTDPVTGKTDGIFARCLQSNTCPKVFHIDGSAEFWNANASLVSNDGADKDVALPSNVRAYLIAGTPHAAGMTNLSSLLPTNTLTASPVMRAMMVNMDAWLAGAAEPPESRWPTLAKGELAPPASGEHVGFPVFKGMPYSGVANSVQVTDYDKTPAKVDAEDWQTLVPTTDADGNDRAGIRLPEVAAPRGTYLGWNPRKPGFAEGDISFLFGSYVPFAKTAAERKANSDPRLSLAERYPTDGAHQRQADAAKAQLEKDRLYLDGDK